MRLIENWRAVMARSYTTWLSIASAIATGVEIANQVAPALMPFLPPLAAAKVALVLSAATPVVRVIQQNFSKGVKHGDETQ